MSQFLQGAISAACEIIPLLNTRAKELMVLGSKGAGGDTSIGADLMCEELFCKHLLNVANIDSEESGFIKSAHKNKDIIILDPLDGSDNYLSNIPYFGASLALCDQNGTIKEAIVINFCTGEAFYDGIKQNNVQKIHIFTNTQLPIRATTPKCGVFEKAYCNPKIAKKLYKHHIKFRSLGAGALSLAYALENNFLLFGGNIRKYDVKAGLFLCRGLEIAHKKDFLLVSQNKKVFGMIARILWDKNHLRH